MSNEAVAAWASIGTLFVIAASAIAALIQLRHMQAGNQLAALLSLERDFQTPGLQAALAYIQTRLPEKLEEQPYRRELETLGFVDPIAHPELVVCNWFNEMGTLVKHRLVSEDTFMDLFGRLIVHCWKRVVPAIAIMRRSRGASQYHDFEYLAMRASAWLGHHPEGIFPRGYVRASLDDRWLDADRT